MKNILITNGYGARTKQPFVSITEESQDFNIQLSPEEAIDLAHNLLSAAEASIQDAFFIEFMRQKVKAEDQQIVGMLEDFRQWRTDREAAQ